MKLFFPYHLGSGNRGCEGITRGILNILGVKSQDVVMYASSRYDFESDKKLGIDQIGDLRFSGDLVYKICIFIAKVMRRFGLPQIYNNFISSYYLRDVKKGDIVFITGGDIYCYENCYQLPNLIAQKAKNKGANTILFGVSMENKFLKEDVVSGLKEFDLITSRESISSKTLSNCGLNNFLFPDPAFSLTPVTCEVPDYFNDADVIGINISNFTNENPLFKENMKRLIEYIISRNMNVCFIPHVFWKNQDDREAILEFSEFFGSSVFILDSEKLSYLQIRYIISKCRFFVGARTHSVISAYSTHIPCIAIGYSVKSIGIAKDIGMPDYTLVDSKKIDDKSVLLNAFKTLEQNTEEIFEVYKKMTYYVERTLDVKMILDEYNQRITQNSE